MENIDDDVERQKIKMAKTTDASFAEEVGVESYPALVFFKEGVPNLYEGDLSVEEEVQYVPKKFFFITLPFDVALLHKKLLFLKEKKYQSLFMQVLDWLTEMKVENHIELITRPMLETMVEETQYLAVFFCKYLKIFNLQLTK